MKENEIQEFRQQFKSIVYQKSEIEKAKNFLKSLHQWDKKGSHEAAIKKHLAVLDEQRSKFKKMLNGNSYEEWSMFSRQLSKLQSRVKNATIQKEKCENQIEEIKFGNNISI